LFQIPGFGYPISLPTVGQSTKMWDTSRAVAGAPPSCPRIKVAMPVSLAPAGRNIYSNGITTTRSSVGATWNEYAAPLGLCVDWRRGYNDVVPPELKNGSSYSRGGPAKS